MADPSLEDFLDALDEEEKVWTDPAYQEDKKLRPKPSVSDDDEQWLIDSFDRR